MRALPILVLAALALGACSPTRTGGIEPAPSAPVVGTPVEAGGSGIVAVRTPEGTLYECGSRPFGPYERLCPR